MQCCLASLACGVWRLQFGWTCLGSSAIILHNFISCSVLICCPWAYGSSLKKILTLHYLAQILGFWLTCGVKMMSSCHGWGWKPPQTACCVCIENIHSVWAHWFAVHGHMAVASNSHSHTTWLRFWGSGSLVEPKWCRNIIVEADSQLKLLTTSTIHMQSVWVHEYAVQGHMAVASNCYTHTTWLRCWGSGSLVESKLCHYVMVEADSNIKLLPTSMLDMSKVFEHIDMLSMGIWQ